MNIIKPLSLAGLSLVALSTFNACADYTPFNEADIVRAEYSKNFFAKYGNFPADMNWDLSDQPRTSATDPSVFELGWNGGITTRAITPNNITVDKLSDDNWYYVEKATQNWALEHLVEGRNNTLEGHPFSLIFPNEGTNNFAIIPIWKGNACITWQLCLSDGTNEKVLWEPWPINNNAEKDRDNNYPPINETDDIQYEYGSNNWLPVEYQGDLATLSEYAVRSRPIIVSGVTGEFYLYLKTTYILDNNPWDDSEGHHEGHQYGTIGEKQSSIGGCMYALTCDAPANINNYKTMLNISEDITKVMVIGCEDHQHGTVDWDVNDIVFLFVGLPDLPTKREVTKSKRYLIEDMGTTVDFDFNDVVVDVTQTSLVDIQNNTEEIYTQEAIIKHLCGTVPFTLYFVDEDGDYYNWNTFNGGNYIQGVVQSLNEECKDTDGNYTYRLVYSKNGSGIANRVPKYFWNSATNNIRIDVGTNGSLTGETWAKNEGADRVKTADFNKPGDTKAPYIIAVPTTVMWTSENEDFPIGEVTQYNSPTSSAE